MWGSYGMSKKVAMQGGDVREGLGGSLLAAASKGVTRGILSQEIIRNLVIKKRVEDFQLGIESYQTQLNLTKPRWEATGLEFMHDYKILDSPRAMVFRKTYGMQMIMRFNEIHKFSDETLQQIDEALDYRVKEFKVNKINPGLNTRFWTTNDVIKSQQFMFAIQKRDEYGCDSASMELTTTTSRSSSDVSVALKDDDLVFDDPITLLKSCQGDYLKMNLPDEWVGAFIVPEVQVKMEMEIPQIDKDPLELNTNEPSPLSLSPLTCAYDLSSKNPKELIFIKDPRTIKSCDLGAKIQACVDIVWKLLVHQGGSPAGIHGLFSRWYCGLASMKVTLGVSMAWAKGVTTRTLVIILRMLKLGRVASKTVGLHAESFS
ncbi:hypothetical protein Tco_0217393 [Tanacetum coccineum]